MTVTITEKRREYGRGRTKHLPDVRITPELDDQIRRAALACGVTVSEWIRERLILAIRDVKARR